MITENARRSLSLFGLAFKSGTDCLREPPGNSCREAHREGIPDPHLRSAVQLSRLTGKNRDFIEREIPHLQGLATSPEAAIQGAEIIIVSHAGSDEIAAIRKGYNGQQILDLLGVDLLQQLGGRSYHGICW